ncbi:MAG: inositol monophosphatase family protein [Sphingomonadales bacterium]|jgi:myo-inositol-1(or 4)-monophosphatase
MPLRSPILNVMVTAILKASRGLSRDFGEVQQLQVSRKGPADFVSTADKKAAGILFEQLSLARPEYGFIMEERGLIKGKRADMVWVVDPLDGTENFLHGIPHFAISIALLEKGRITAAVVYNPIQDEMYWAEDGKGAWMNDRRLRVSARSSLGDCLLATGIPWKGRPGQEEFEEELKSLSPNVAGIRCFGSAALDLAYVAAGRYDGFWKDNLKSWNIAAGILLVKEAGGYVTQTNGESNPIETGSLLATNEQVHSDLQKSLQEAGKVFNKKNK